MSVAEPESLRAGNARDGFPFRDTLLSKKALKGSRLDGVLVAILFHSLFVWDVVVAVLSGYVATICYAYLVNRGHILDSLEMREALVGACVTPIALRDANASGNRLMFRNDVVVRRLLHRIPILLGTLFVVSFATETLEHLPRLWMGIWVCSTIGLALLGRLALARFIGWSRANGRLKEIIAIVGAGPVADRLFGGLAAADGSAVEVIGIFDDRVFRSPANSVMPIGSIQDLVTIGKARHIDRILVTLPWNAEERLLGLLKQLKQLSVEVALSPPEGSIKLPQKAVEFLGDMPMMVVANRPLQGADYLVKLLEDKVLAALLLIPILPIMGVIAAAIKLTSDGPIFFRQERVGWNNTVFHVFKFRTMRWEKVQRKEIEQTRRDDDRITPLGKFLRRSSLDELPQLFNVLRGEMSLVGPRPHALTMRTENQLGEEIVAEYAHRHRVRPGITGWAQVNGYRGATERVEQLRRRVEYDLYYIENWSVLFDIKILLLTFVNVIFSKNAF